MFNNNKLSTSLILGVFTANSDARCLREKYERCFVKKKISRYHPLMQHII